MFNIQSRRNQRNRDKKWQKVNATSKKGDCMNTQKKIVTAILEQSPGDLKSPEIHMLKAKANIETMESVVRKRNYDTTLHISFDEQYKNDRQRKKAVLDLLIDDKEYQDMKKELRIIKSDLEVFETEYKYKKRTMLNQRALCYLIGDEENDGRN